jgi:chaperone modulatory protein CbpM
MNAKSGNVTITGVILDERTQVTLDDLCRTCSVDQTTILQLVEEGVVEPSSREISSLRFSSTTVPLVARAVRLQRDLELNPAGVAFALELLDEIELLRSRIKFIESSTGKQHD